MDSKFNFSLGKESRLAELKVANQTWVTYHVTKHFILANETEHMGRLAFQDSQNSNQRIKDIRQDQIKNMNCKINEYKPKSEEKTCKK